jgi:hypothetical protein
MSESKTNSLSLGEKTIKQCLAILLDDKVENLIFAISAATGASLPP